MLKLKFLSYGITNDGGYRHESFLFNLLLKQPQIEGIEKRFSRLYTDIFEHLNLLFTSFFNSDSEVNMVVSRMGVSSLLRNWFSSKKTIIVWHYHDEDDYNGNALQLYFRFMFFLLRKSKKNKAAVVCVAPFWQNYFSKKINNPNVPVFLFPNFFDAEKYAKFRNTPKKKRIHLGQFSEKNFNNLDSIAIQLVDQDYEVYYSTLFEDEEELDALIQIKHFPDFDSYLMHMAESRYTLALPGFNEGWNRVAHESVLCGTPVIGFDKGGLGDLLRESNQHTAKNEKEVLEHIEKQETIEPSREFIDKYSPVNANKYIKPIKSWIQG